MMRGIVSVLLALLALLALGEYVWGTNDHAVFPWHRWPGFHVAMGIGASLIAIFIIKPLGKRLLQRPEGEDE